MNTIRCYGCGKLNPTDKAWFVTSYGPGGGIDPYWRVMGACVTCADKPWGEWDRLPNVKPPGASKDSIRAKAI